MIRKKKYVSQAAPLMLLFLAAFFLAGVFLGQVAAEQVSVSLQSELNRYLADYLEIERSGALAAEAFLSTAVLYIRWSLAAFLLGFASAGTILLPCTAVLFGASLSFSVSCFVAAFGANGILISCASFGLRVLVTLPCFLILAVPAWEASFQLAVLSFGKGRRIATALYGKRYWMRLCVAAVVLLVGLCLDLLLTPWFMQLVLT